MCCASVCAASHDTCATHNTGTDGVASLQHCVVSHNKSDGIVARDGGSINAQDSQLLSNGGYGISVLNGGTAAVQHCRLARNAMGPAALPGADPSDAADRMTAENELDGSVTLL
jgi:hypothetical protein